MKRFAIFTSVIAIGLGLCACGEQAPGGDGDGGSGAQAGAGGSGGQGAAGGGGQGGGELCANGEFGFQFRKPGSHSILCDSYPPGYPEDPQVFTDVDWLCTFDYDGTQGHVYIQATPVSCKFVMSAEPSFSMGTAQISIAGSPVDVSNALYSWGGNHHNDTLSFEHDGYRFVYDHSSFGWGWRKCQPMDCLRVYQGQQLIENGCTVDRTLPVVCEQIRSDCSHESLEDDFEPCPGDPNYP